MGRPDAEIVRLAEEIGAEMVVVGSRGLGLLRRAVLGSVSNGVVRQGSQLKSMAQRSTETDESAVRVHDLRNREKQQSSDLPS